MTELKSRKRLFFLAAAMVAFLALAACSDSYSNLNKFYQGRTLHINVVKIERVPEVRYATIDPEQVIRHWRIVPSALGMELVLVRMKVENHTAINAVVDVDQQAAELRDFIQGSYFPINLSERIYQDLRNQAEVSVRMSLGQCFDPNQMYISQGTRVGWVNEGSVVHYVDLDGDGQNLAPINPGETFFSEFSTPGEVAYQCSADGTGGQGAQVVVEADDGGKPVDERSMVFIDGSFELARDMGIDGWVIFEAPEGTKFRDLRWRAGDSITITF